MTKRRSDSDGAPLEPIAAAATSDDRRLLEEYMASRESLAEAQRIAHFGSWDWNIAEGTLTWSDEIYRIFGLEPQQFGATYEAFLDYIHPEDRGKVEQAVAEALKGVKRYSVEHRVVRPDGEERIVHERAEVRRDGRGQPERMLGTVQDITEQKHLEHELARSQAYNRGLIEASADGLITVNAGGQISDVNEQMCRMSGRSREQLIGSSFASYFADPKRAEAGVRETFEKGLVNDYVLTLLPSSGGEIVVSFNAALYRGEQGEVAGIFASARDISEQVGLQEELARSQAYNRGLIEASADGLITIDHKGVISDVNEQMCRMSGRSREQLIGSSFSSYFADPKQATAGVRETFKKGLVNDYVLTLLPSGGGELVVSFNAALYRGEQGEVAGIFASARDISEQKQLENEMRDAQLYTRSLIEASLDALLTTDESGAITDVNAEMEALTGYTRAELIGSRLRHHVADPERAAAAIEQVLREGAIRDFELTIQGKTGAETDVSFNATTFLDQHGRLRGIFASARDVTERKRLEEEKYITRFFDLALDLLCIANVDGEFIRVSPAFEQQLGWAPDELHDRPILELVHPEDRELTQAMMMRQAQGAPAINVENRFRCKDGSYRWLLWRTSSPELGLLYGVARDITDWKQRDEELRMLAEEREKALLRTQALQRVSAGLTAAITPEQVLQVVFDEAFSALGADSGALGLISDDGTQIESKRIGLPQDLIERFASSPIDENLPQNACARDGVEFWCSSLEELESEYPEPVEILRQVGYKAFICLPLRSEGETIGFLAARFREQQALSERDRAFARSIAEQCSQALARARLHEQRSELADAALVIERVGDGIFRLDEEGRITTWNPAAARMSGVSEASALGRRVGEILEGWDDPAGRLELAPPGEPATRRSLPFNLGGRELWLSISGVPLPNGAVYAFHDVTAEHELEQRQHDFIATVSHELRTPLASVYGALFTLQRSMLDLDTRELMLKIATEQSERLRRLVDEILIASEVDTTELRIQDLNVDPLEIARSVVDASRSMLPAGLTLDLSSTTSLPSLSTDPDRLQQVLSNVIDNAIKFSPNGGAIKVEISARPESIVFTISDQGIGIPAVERERIFERFYRLDPEQTGGIGGTGLGLFICRELVERMGGTIEVDSVEGGGSSFSIELPREHQQGSERRDETARR